MGEYHANPKRFETFFIDGAVPDKATRAKLRGMMTKLELALVDDTGSSATAEVVYEVLANRGDPGPRRVEAGQGGGPMEGERFRVAGRICRKPVRANQNFPFPFLFLRDGTHAITASIPTSKANWLLFRGREPSGPQQ